MHHPHPSDDTGNRDKGSRQIDDTYVFDSSIGLYLPRSYSRKKWVKPFIKILTLALIAGTVFFAWRQWREMASATKASEKAALAAKNAADVATNTFKLTFRPRIKILSISPNNITTNGLLSHNLDKGRFTVVLNAPNTGPFAARNVRFFIYDNVSSKSAVKRLEYTELNGMPKLLPSKDEGGYGVMTITGLRVLSAEEKMGLRDGSLYATFSILISYDDDLGESHHAEYCDLVDWTPYNDICPWPVRND
jgi:hypothetical protein